MIDVADSNAVYNYHYDGLGSVVALSDSSGDSCQSYEYSVYGQVAASDPNFITNPYMFTGRRFDYETGLYYYRARYYNPYIGRFLQTDPIGYGDGMNLYAYCGNNPLGFVDPFGLGGLIWREYGIPYILSERVREWSEGEAFQSGEAGWRFAEGPLLVAGSLMTSSTSGSQYRWFRTHVLSWSRTAEGGVRFTVAGRLTYVGKHAALANEAPHARQIAIKSGETWKTIIKW